MSRRSSNIQRRAVDLRRPWVSQRGTSPLALAIRLEQDAAREATSRETPLELLQRATPAQILAASRGAMSPSATRADVSAAWDKLRRAVKSEGRPGCSPGDTVSALLSAGVPNLTADIVVP